MKNIYGTIGYTLLENTNINKKVIILADMHDTLPQCINQTNVSDWFKSKFGSSKILLEEVPREDFSLSELWSDSPHTQNLKNLFLSNSKIIQAVDIRPYLIPFSWEILSESNEHLNANTEDYNIVLKTYVVKINRFFSMKEKYFLKNIPNYNLDNLPHTKLGKHFLAIKKNWKIFLEKYNHLLNEKLINMVSKNKSALANISDLLDEIMEWYICACIHVYSDKSMILHTGLAHSEKVIEWLTNHYEFKIIQKEGINSMEEIFYKPLKGCMVIPTNIETQFGGINSEEIYGFFD